MTETAASSSGVPMSVTSSPLLTRVSRPGQTSTSPAGGTTATGASAPYSSRSVAACGAAVRAARNRIPDSFISCTPSPRQTSTMDGADRPATSSTATPTCLTARPTAGLSSCAITRTSGRSRRVSSAVSSADRSSSWAQITAIAPARPADVSVSSARAGPVTSGTPQAAMIRASAGAGLSSTTTAGTPESASCSTISRPTACSPQTITCPCQPACTSPTGQSMPGMGCRHVTGGRQRAERPSRCR